MAGRKRGRYDYLNAAAETLSREVWKRTVADCKGRDPTDGKTVKELEALLKEAVGICLSLEKSESAAVPEIRVVFEDGIGELAE